MLFENALYYPTIDIMDEAWLKSAVLLWDQISTIVPESMHVPYRNSCSRDLAAENVLRPYQVNPFSVNFPCLEKSVIEYLNSPQGKTAFKRKVNNRHRAYYSVDKDTIIRNYGDFYICAEKFGIGLKRIIDSYVNDNGYVITDKNFMNFYMTALANNICQRNNMALLTNLKYTSGLTNTILHEFPNKKLGDDMLKQGLMYNMIINGFMIDPQTPIDEILEFRGKYYYEMAEFRKQVSDMVNTLNTEGMSADEIAKQIECLYKMGVLPALNNIQRALDGQKIKWIVDGAETIAITGTTTCLSQLPNSLLSGLVLAGIKIGCSLFRYKANREDSINGKPFSMLYRINKHFNKNSL